MITDALLIASLLLNAILLARIVRTRRKAWNKKRKRYVGRLKRWLRLRVAYGWSSRLPVRENLVVFESYRGESFSGNPRYIALELAARKAGFRCVVGVNDPKKDRGLPPGFVQVKRMGFRYHAALARAKYFVNNVNYPDFVEKRPGTVHIQTMHGTPLKLMGSDIIRVEDKAHDIDLLGLFVRSKRWDVLVSPNAYTTEIFKRVFRHRGPVLESGYPRNDVLVRRRDDEAFREAMRERLGLPEGKRVLLYAPTWRDYEAKHVRKSLAGLYLDLQAMREALADDFVVLVRLHHLVRSNLDLTELSGFVWDVSDYEDGQELCALSDALISDYSSIIFDYAVLRRPILLFMPDYERYRAARGMYFDLRAEAPGPVAKTTAEVIDALSEFDELEERFAEPLQTFHERFCSLEDGTASAAVVDGYILRSEETS